MTDGKVLEPLEALQAMAERTRLRDSREELATAMAAAKAVQAPRPTLRAWARLDILGGAPTLEGLRDVGCRAFSSYHGPVSYTRLSARRL